MALTFLTVWLKAVGYSSPILIVLLGFLFFCGMLLGRLEDMPRKDSLYLAFITALTVGYGDKTPKTGKGKVLCIFIGLFGMCFTGVFVGCSLFAAEAALKMAYIGSGL